MPIDATDRHEMPESFYDTPPADIYIPVNQPQISDLLGKLLTIADAVIPPGTQVGAAKSLIRQTLSGWFDEAKTNSVTSYRGCLAPIQVLRAFPEGTERKYVWLAEGNHAVSMNLDDR